MKPSNFRERLSYARWLHHGATGLAPGNAEIGRAVNRSGAWVTKWAASDDPPRDYEVHEPLAGYLGVDERWLIRGEGEPPRVDLWTDWLVTQRKRAKELADATNEGRRGTGATRGGATKKREA